MEEKKFKVLIIEDDEKDYSLAKGLLPDSCVTAYNEIDEDNFHQLLLKSNTSVIENNALLNGFVSESCEELFKFIENNKEDLRLIICDYRWNGADSAGSVFIDRLRRKKDWFMENIPVVVITRYSIKFTEQSAFELNFNVLSKELLESNDGLSRSFKNGLEQRVENFDKLYQQHINDKLYKVAFSFTGSNHKGTCAVSHREFVRDVARIVMRTYGDKVFYDQDCDKTTHNLEDFKNLYENDCNFIVVFLSDDYANKDSEWTKKEWKGIKTHFNKKGVCKKKNVIFVDICEEVSYEEKLKKLGVSPHHTGIIAIEAIKNYYNILENKSEDIKKAVIDNCLNGKSELKEVLKSGMEDFVNKYHKNSELEEIAEKIINHIKDHDKSE